MLESGTGSARPFPSEPEDPQGEEGVASRHENAETLILLHSSQISSSLPLQGRGCLGERAAETPLPLHHAGYDISGGAAPLRQTPE